MLIAEGFEDILNLQKPPATATALSQSQTRTQKLNEFQTELEILPETQSAIESRIESQSTENKIESIPMLAASQSTTAATATTAAVTNIVPRFQPDLRPLIPVPRGAYRKIMVRTLCHYYYHLSCFSLTLSLPFLLQ